VIEVVDKDLATDMKISILIRGFNRRKEEIWFSKLIELLDGKISKREISETIDKLYDLGFIDAEWKKVDEKWTRVFSIAPQAKDLIDSVSKYSGYNLEQLESMEE